MKDLEHEASGNVFPGDLRERVSRQMILRELGEKGQAAISSAHFLVIGAGGLGSPAILYLAAAGAGTITVVDADTVSVSNLSRQILHTTSTVNVNKAKSAAIAVERLNPHCRIIPVPEFADAVKLKALVKNADVILDCTDNLATRIAVSRAAHDAGKPLVFASAVRFSGHRGPEDRRRHRLDALQQDALHRRAQHAVRHHQGEAQEALPRLRRKALKEKRALKPNKRNGPETKVRGRSVRKGRPAPPEGTGRPAFDVRLRSICPAGASSQDQDQKAYLTPTLPPMEDVPASPPPNIMSTLNMRLPLTARRPKSAWTGLMSRTSWL